MLARRALVGTLPDIVLSGFGGILIYYISSQSMRFQRDCKMGERMNLDIHKMFSLNILQ